MKKIGLLFILLIIILAGIFMYMTRPVISPTLEESEKMAGNEGEMNVEGSSVYKIDQTKTKAGFSLGEDLREKPFTVVGTTSSVFGELVLNNNEPEKSILGTIKIDARTLKTDSSNRDGAIARLILNSEKTENNFITFKPTNVTGIPGDAKAGVSYDFKVTGVLTISGVSKEVTFDTKAMATAEGTIEGTATSVIKRADFKLTIPNIPFVANVDEEVDLKLDFVLRK